MEFFVTRVLGLLVTIVDASTGAAIGVGVLAALVRTAKLSVRRAPAWTPRCLRFESRWADGWL
jgi:hypothetical protein